jgi:hypothetical protein
VFVISWPQQGATDICDGAFSRLRESADWSDDCNMSCGSKISRISDGTVQLALYVQDRLSKMLLDQAFLISPQSVIISVPTTVALSA